jgi:hypothetical protein
MANVVEEIFKLNADTNDLITKLRQAKGVYSELTKEQEQQLIQLGLLEKKEKELIAAREKSANPTAIIKYNAAIDATVKDIGALKEATDKLTASESKTAAEANAVSKAISNAFKGTTLAAASKEVDKIAKSFEGTSTGVENAEKKTISLKAQLGELKAQLADDNLDDGQFEELSIKAGKIQDAIEEAGDAARVFTTDSPFEAVGNALGSVGQKLLSLDFAGAARQSQLLVKATQQITFSQALGGIKDLGSTLLNVGKSLLKNPLFLIGAAVAIVVLKFNDLKNSTGLIGSAFRIVGNIIDGVINTFYALSDAVGLTQNAMDDSIKRTIDSANQLAERTKKAAERQIEVAKALGKETSKMEAEKQRAYIKTLQVALEAYNKKSYLTTAEIKEQQELADKIVDSKTELQVIEASNYKARADLAKKYTQDVTKTFDDLNKKIIDLTNKGSEFNIKFKFQDGSQAQLDEVYKLRKDIEEKAQKELEKTTLKGLKTEKDISDAKVELATIASKTKTNRENEYSEASLSLALVNGQKQIAFEKQVADASLALTTQTESQKANISVQIQEDANKKTIQLLEDNIAKKKELVLSTVELEKELGILKLNQEVEFAKASNDLLAANSADSQKQIEFEKQHASTLLTIKNKSNSSKLFSDIAYEKQKLDIMEQSFGQYSQEYKTQLDKITLLEKEAKKQRILEVISYFETAINAAVSATSQILSAKQKEVEGQITLQQKRVDEAKDIADKGNSQVLELEQKRLDELNKKRANYVKQQQALAAVELVANTAIAVSKAAAEGGAAAGVTIAAALLALVAGLASARSVASQAAYYEGGYTGDGNPRDESKKVGSRPYMYHKGEFVMDHKKTRSYRDIFEDVHAGRIDLNKWKEKVQAYDQMATHRMMVSSAPMQMLQPQIINSGADMKRLESQMTELIFIMQNKRFGNDLVWNERGVITRMNSIINRENKLKQIAKP